MDRQMVPLCAKKNLTFDGWEIVCSAALSRRGNECFGQLRGLVRESKTG
jgi:hypothetical protein